jgi:meso-butanediol dehydrogenase/(S,S)-butanediol dehydrogenase/diacetyl reductase
MTPAKSARLQGKAAIVTGGASGIGAAVVKLFREHGAQVLVVDKAQAEGGMVGDVSEAATAREAVARAVREFGKLNVLVNNAAARDVAPLSEGKEEAWRKVLDTNVIGTLNFIRAALPQLRKAEGASIVNVASIFALHGRKPFAAYDASKAALLAMTRTASVEEASHGVRVNAVCPGGTLTPFVTERRGKSAAELRSEKKADALLGRWAEPIEVAWPILWLASDEASYITGAVIPVDGGSSGSFT